MNHVRQRLLLVAFPLVCLAALIGFRFWQFNFDDAYISYRIAENIVRGDGWMYNPGERINGATSALWTLILALGARVTGLTSATAHLAGTAALFFAALVLRILLHEVMSPLAANAAVFLFMTSPLLLMAFGLETHLYMAWALLALWASAKDRLIVLGAALGLLILTRPDGIVLAVLLLFHRLFHDRRIPWQTLGPIAGLLAPWYLFSLLYFGRVFPNTLAAKMAQGRSGAWPIDLPWPLSTLPLFAKGVWFWWHEIYRPPLSLVLAVCVLLLGLMALRQWRSLGAAVILWAGMHVIAYSLLNVPSYHWYYAPVVLAFVVIVGLGLARIEEWGRRIHPRLATPIVTLLASLLLLPHLLSAYSTTIQLPNPREAAYEEIGRWLHANTPPGTTVAAAEIGTLGYFSNRRMIDMTGIIDPRGPRYLRRGELDWWLDKRRPDLVLIHDPPFSFERVALQRPDFVQRYEHWRDFRFEGYGSLFLFRRKDFVVRGSSAP